MAHHSSGSKSYRMERVSSQIRKHMSDVIRERYTCAIYGLVTVTHVRLARDMSWAWVHIRTTQSPDDMLSHLNRAQADFRRLLALRMSHMRKIPALKFQRDDFLDRAERVTNLIDQVVSS